MGLPWEHLMSNSEPMKPQAKPRHKLAIDWDEEKAIFDGIPVNMNYYDYELRPEYGQMLVTMRFLVDDFEFIGRKPERPEK